MSTENFSDAVNVWIAGFVERNLTPVVRALGARITAIETNLDDRVGGMLERALMPFAGMVRGRFERLEERVNDQPAGQVGPMPRHQWRGTELRFELPDGWGPFVELQGADGKPGIQGPRGRSGGGAGFAAS